MNKFKFVYYFTALAMIISLGNVFLNGNFPVEGMIALKNFFRPITEEVRQFLTGRTIDPIILVAGASKLALIKVINKLTGLAIKKAKELVDNAPRFVKIQVSKANAD